MAENLIPTSLDVAARQDAAAALDAAASLDAKVDSLTEQVAGMEAGNAASLGLPTTSTWVQLPHAGDTDAPIDIVNLPAGTSVQVVVDVVSGFPEGSALEIRLAGEAIPNTAWQGTPPKPDAPGTYATAPIGTGEAILLTRRGVITASLASSAATAGTARVTIHHPPVRRPDDGILNVQDWGVLPENDGHTNTQNLLALRDWCRARPDTLHHIIFPPSEASYDYLRSDWTWGIRRFRLSGYGAKLNNADTDRNRTPEHLALCYYTNANMWYDWVAGEAGGLGAYHPSLETMGTRIDTVAKNAVTITLKEADPTIEVGTNILIYGLSRQDGKHPPNPVYFEYNKVRSINGLELTLEQRTEFEYREDWPEPTDPTWDLVVGRARVLSLNRPEYNICEYALIEGIEFVPAGAYNHWSWTSRGDLFIRDILECVVRDVTCETLVVSNVKRATLERVTSTNNYEPDKVAHTVRHFDCTFARINQAQGILNFIVKRCSILNIAYGTGKASYAYAYNQIWRDNDFYGNGSHHINPGLDGFNHDIVIFEKNRFHGTARPIPNFGLEYVFSSGVSSSTDDGVTTTSFTVPDGVSGSVSRRIKAGRPFFAAPDAGQPNEDEFITGRVIAVKAAPIHTVADRDLIIEVEASGIFPENGKLYFPTVEKLLLKNNDRLLDLDFVLSRARNTFRHYQTITGNGSGNHARIQAAHFGFLDKVRYKVLRPDTGTGVSPVLNLVILRQQYLWNTRLDPVNVVKSNEFAFAELPVSPSDFLRLEVGGLAFNRGRAEFEAPIIEVEYDVVWLGP